MIVGVASFFSKLFGGSNAEESVSEAAPSCADHHAAPAKRENSRPRRPKCADSDSGRSCSMKDLEAFVEYISKALVDYPDEVRVCGESGENGKMVKIFCRAGDRGKIIGKKGKTIMALRSLVAGAAGKMQERVSVEVIDEEVND